jgi:hypothetical protein
MSVEHQTVIPARPEGSGPESITTDQKKFGP